jgi:serine phosphatase RsbU (regulator of sigma subunit)
MSATTKRRSRLVEWAAASRPCAGEDVSGDLHLALEYRDSALLAVVDGLGHGVEAAFAAKVAVATLERYATEPLVPLVRRCHEMLQQTRGAAMCLVSIVTPHPSMSWLSVGNVDAVLLHADAGAPCRRAVVTQFPGVVGYRIPRLSPQETLPLSRGDTLVLATDGVRQGFVEAVNTVEPPQKLADRIAKAFGDGTDDALVLVARFLGAEA